MSQYARHGVASIATLAGFVRVPFVLRQPMVAFGLIGAGEFVALAWAGQTQLALNVWCCAGTALLFGLPMALKHPERPKNRVRRRLGA